MPFRRGCDEILAVQLLPDGQGGRNVTVLALRVPGMTVACHGALRRNASRIPHWEEENSRTTLPWRHEPRHSQGEIPASLSVEEEQ